MSRMNAVVMAENRPDSATGQAFWLCEREGTHENEGGIQIVIVLLLEIFVVLGDFFFELVVETGPGVFGHRPQCVT